MISTVNNWFKPKKKEVNTSYNPYSGGQSSVPNVSKPMYTPQTQAPQRKFTPTASSYSPKPQMTPIPQGQRMPQAQQTPQWTQRPQQQSATPQLPTPEAPEAPKDNTQMYLDYLRENQNLLPEQEQKQIDYAKTMTDDRVGGINQGANISVANYGKQIEGYKERGENYGDLIKSNIELAREGADASKQDIESQYATSEAQLAKTKQREDIKRRNMFAALGTLESGGSMGFTGQQSEADIQFSTDLQDFKEGKIRDINDVNRRQQEFENTSIYKLQDTLDQFNAQIDNIYADISKTEVQRNNDISAAYQDISDKVFEIQSTYSTANDSYEKMRYEVGSKIEEKAGASNQSKQDIIDTVSGLLGRDYGAITGLRNPLKFMTGDAQYTKNMFNQLVGLLSLENRQKLKGSGAISDYESKVLERAATALGTNLNNEDFGRELQNILSVFGGQSTQGGTQVTMTDPQGNKYTVDQGEVQEALANGWRTL